MTVHSRGLVEALRAIGRAPSQPGSDSGRRYGPRATPSLAVLPFANLSANPDNEYLSDGITEEIINTLGHLPQVRVAGRTSSFAFKGMMPEIADVGAKLKVSIVLTGSVQRAGTRLRIRERLPVPIPSSYRIKIEVSSEPNAIDAIGFPRTLPAYSLT